MISWNKQVINKRVLGAGVVFLTLGVACIGYSFIESSILKTKQEYAMNYTSVDKPKSKTSKFSDVLVNADMKVEEVKDYKSVIDIPSLKITAPITEGVGSNMDYSVGHFPNSPSLDDNGNICLAGHRSEIYDCVFNDLNKLGVGDTINIYNNDGICYDYTVTRIRTVAPDSLNVLNDYGDNRLTIVTCTDKGTRRLIVVAKILSEEEKDKLLSGVYDKCFSSTIDNVQTFKKSMQEVVNTTDFLDETRPYKHTDVKVSMSNTYKYSDNLFKNLS